jgi:hypothetical protein
LGEKSREEEEEEKDEPVNHLRHSLVVHPHRLSDRLDGSDVRVGTEEDVLELGDLR